jgi:hypothetical protein
VKLSARSALTRVQSFISESSGGLTLFSFSQKCKLSIGSVQGVRMPSKVLEFANLRNCWRTTAAGSAQS